MNWFENPFFILMAGFPMASLLSSWIVATYIWHPLKEKYETAGAENPVVPTIIPYENQYPFKFPHPIKDNSGQILEHAMVLENTKQGYVLMRYNEGRNIFEYWGDENIQYKYLETVARKFVQRFRCEHLYINRYLELRKKWIQLQKEKEEAKKKAADQKEIEKDKDDDIFATLKSAPKQQEKKRDILVCDKANKYIKRGRLNECSFFKNKKVDRKPFSFMDWKKMKFL